MIRGGGEGGVGAIRGILGDCVRVILGVVPDLFSRL